MRYLIGLLIAIVVIIFIIIKLLSGGGGGSVVQKPTLLTDYANTDTVMRLTIQNPVQSPQTHRDIQVTVGRETANLTIYKGYDNQVVSSKTYAMNEAAYSDFLHGLLISGKYTTGNNEPSVRNESGYCATGDRYVYEVIDDTGKDIQHLWSTSCGDKTFRGNISIVTQLFENEIPNYGVLTSDVVL